MTVDWARLAEPFADEQVKQRPGRGGMTFSYVDPRAVMQRLDDVVTPEAWEFTSTVIPGTDIVHGRLTVAGNVKEDYGYPNSDHDEEPIKSASSDALKRCAVMFGIGRHLYGDNTRTPSRSTGRVGSPPPARPAAAPRSSTAVPEEPDGLFEERQHPKPSSGGGGLSFKELATMAEDKGVDKRLIYQTADQLFGKGTKVTDLSGGEREQIAFEMGLVA